MRRSKGTYYRKSLLIILLVASIPGLITGLGIYWFAVGQIEHDLKIMHKKQISQRVQMINDQFAYLERSLSHWAFEPRFGTALNGLDAASSFRDTRNLIKTLHVMEGAHPLINHVQLYINKPSPLFFDPEYTLLEDNKMTKQYDDLLLYPRNMFWYTDTAQEGAADSEVPVEVVLVHKIPGGAATPGGLLRVTLKQDLLQDLLKTLTPYNEGTTFLLNERLEPILSTGSDSASVQFEGHLQSKVQRNGMKNGDFIERWRGNTYVVSYGAINRLDTDWVYISAAPLSAITAPIIFASKVIVIISAVMLLAALGMSWLASRRIYLPLEKLIRLLPRSRMDDLHRHGMDEFKLLEKEWQHMTKESSLLQSQLEKELPHIKTGFMMQLLQGHLNAFSEQDLRKRMKQYGWNVDLCQFTLLNVQLTGVSNLEHRFSPGEEGLVTFAAANIIEEISAEQLEQFSVINFHNLSVGLVVMTSAEIPAKKVINDLCEAITESINEWMKLKVAVTISRPLLQVSSLPELYLDVTRGIGMRWFRDENQIIEMESLLSADRKEEGAYPFSKDREIQHALRMGQRDTIEQLVDQFLDELMVENGAEYAGQQNVLQLFGNMQFTILQSGMQPASIFSSPNMFEQLTHIREQKQLSNWFKEEVIHPYIQKYEENSNLQLKQKVEQTIHYLQMYYKKDISLDQCADLTGTSPYTLSKAFKQVVGVNFIDYLTELRMDQARELLRTTDMRVNEVAEQVGYQPSYFNRLFKKHEGETPSRYREKWLVD